MASVLFLHIIVILLSFFVAYKGAKNKNKKDINYGILLSFFILLLFLGFRVYLGRDWPNYERSFNSSLQQEFIFGESREIGYLALVSLLRACGFEFQSFIFATSFLFLFLFYLSYKRFYFLLPCGILIFFMDWGYPVAINTIRQGIAIMAFLNATLYIDSNEKNAPKKFFFFILVGLLFHYSILIFLPFYFVGKLKLRIEYYILLCLAVFFSSVFIIMPAYEETINIVDKYESYASDTGIVNEASTFGLGALLVLVIRLAPITIYSYVRKFKPAYLKFFVLYFLGLSVYYGFYKFMLITRVTFYLQFMELFVIAYFLYYLFVERKKYRLFGIGYMFLIIFNYLYTFQDFLADQLVSDRFSLMFMDFYFKI